MKKLLILTSLVTSLISSAAFAKTEGHYVGLSLIHADIRSGDLYEDNASGNEENNGNVMNIKQNQTSFGVNYKYAFNFGSVYVAPGAYYNYLNVSDHDVFNDKWTFESTAGARVDLGADITDYLAPYIFTGIGVINIDYNRTSAVGAAGDSPFTTEEESFITLPVGLGIKTSVTPNFDLNLEYEYAYFEFETNSYSEQQFHLSTVRFGGAYKF